MLTQAELKEYFHYDPETGIFTMQKDWYKTKQGDVVGVRHSEGYLYICFKRNYYYLHRLAFLYMAGYSPEHTVDHINGIREDNRWQNLRHASIMCQRQNTSRLNTNRSGFKGVSWNTSQRKYFSQIIVNKKHYSLGVYDCILDAALARIAFEDMCPQWSCDARDWNRKKVFATLKEAIETQDVSTWVYTEPGRRNKTGYKGVTKQGSRFTARANIKGKRLHIGTFPTVEEAAAAREKFKTKETKICS